MIGRQREPNRVRPRHKIDKTVQAAGVSDVWHADLHTQAVVQGHGHAGHIRLAAVLNAIIIAVIPDAVANRGQRDDARVPRVVVFARQVDGAARPVVVSASLSVVSAPTFCGLNMVLVGTNSTM
jgi:hypothetical protein